MQSVGDYFYEKVVSLIHEMHSCKLDEQLKCVTYCNCMCGCMLACVCANMGLACIVHV